MTPRTATLIGFCAVLMWSSRAPLTAMTGPVPAFLLTGITFLIGGTVILAQAALRGQLRQAWPTPASFALGIYGPFGDTALYFAALKLAPPAQANLVHYLWPLLIVLFAALLPGGRLSPRHLAGALIGLLATVLLIGDRAAGEGGSGGNDAAVWLGYGFAALGAAVWASYSVLSRRVAQVSPDSIGVTLLACAIPAFALHFALETPRLPQTTLEWIGAIGLGLGPMGLALLCWDIGMKRGDVAFLGVASYAAPVLSTILLVVLGFAAPSWTLALACGLIVTGALIASFPMGALRRIVRRSPT
jgi:drug/metabolite transporter (DMT)-like permease